MSKRSRHGLSKTLGKSFEDEDDDEDEDDERRGTFLIAGPNGDGSAAFWPKKTIDLISGWLRETFRCSGASPHQICATFSLLAHSESSLHQGFLDPLLRPNRVRL